MVKLENVKKFYNKGAKNQLNVIDDISMELPEKGMIAILGESGCGKTTLLNSIGGMTSIDSGCITIDDCEVSSEADNIRNELIGYIYQNYNLNNNDTVLQNVADALRLVGANDENEINSLSIKALELVGLEKYLKRKANSLSGGQQQRVSIARAIVKKPRIILADEPTGNLDEENTHSIARLLKSISKKSLVLIVTHEKDIAYSYCDSIIELSDGKIVKITDNNPSISKNIKENTIYLEDFDKEEKHYGDSVISLYGDFDKCGIDIKLLNDNGKIYMQIASNNVTVVDDESAVKIEEKRRTKECIVEQKESYDLADFTSVDKNNIGKLYNIKRAIITAKERIKNAETSSMMLRKSIFILGIITVLVCSFFAYGIKEIVECKKANNQDMFYAYIYNDDMAKKITDSKVNSENGIKEAYFYGSSISVGDNRMYVLLPQLQSSNDINAEENSEVSFHASFLSKENMSENELIDGKFQMDKGEVVITTAVADQILSNVHYDYINTYDDIIGMIGGSVWSHSDEYKIVGIVDSKDSIVYREYSYFDDTASCGYAIIQSSDVKKTDKFLKDLLKNERAPLGWDKVYYSPMDINALYCGNQFENNSLYIFIWIAITLVLSLLIVFLLKAEMMKKSKAIAIYRCLGVKKNNIVFYYFIENMMSAVLSGVVGMLLCDGVIYALKSGKYSYIFEHKIYYPMWISLLVFVFFCTITVLSGILPIRKMIKKEPSELLVDYDI